MSLYYTSHTKCVHIYIPSIHLYLIDFTFDLFLSIPLHKNHAYGWMDRHMDAQLDTTIAPDILNMYAK